MRNLFRADLMLASLTINVALLAAAVAIFLFLVHRAREAGSLLQTGE
jgi:hypothetical protein